MIFSRSEGIRNAHVVQIGICEPRQRYETIMIVALRAHFCDKPTAQLSVTLEEMKKDFAYPSSLLMQIGWLSPQWQEHLIFSGNVSN